MNGETSTITPGVWFRYTAAASPSVWTFECREQYFHVGSNTQMPLFASPGWKPFKATLSQQTGVWKKRNTVTCVFSLSVRLLCSAKGNNSEENLNQLLCITEFKLYSYFIWGLSAHDAANCCEQTCLLQMNKKKSTLIIVTAAARHLQNNDLDHPCEKVNYRMQCNLDIFCSEKRCYIFVILKDNECTFWSVTYQKCVQHSSLNTVYIRC